MIKLPIFKIALFLCILSNIYGQTELNVSLKPQVAKFFCWAASSEMVLSFNGFPQNQCKLVKRYANTSGVNPNPICCNSLCLNGSCPYPISPCTTCSDIVLTDGNYIKSVLDYYMLKSTIANNGNLITRITWDRLTKQIDNCKPMVAVFDVEGNSTDTEFFGRHAATIKGYWIPSSPTDSFIMIADPWKPCIGDSSVFINFAVVRGLTTGNRYKNIFEYFYDMLPKNPATIISCNPNRYKVSESTQRLMKNGILKTLSISEFNALSYTKIPLRFVLPNTLLPNFQNHRVGDTLRENDLVEVIDQTGEVPIVTVMQLVKSKWRPVEIKRFDYLPSITVKIDNKDVILNNSNMGGDNVPFEHIIFSESFYEFYRFKYNGKEYLVPIFDTTNLKVNNKKVFQYKPYNINNIWKTINNNTPNLIMPNNSKKY